MWNGRLDTGRTIGLLQSRRRQPGLAGGCLAVAGRLSLEVRLPITGDMLCRLRMPKMRTKELDLAVEPLACGGS